ncbi:MAG TPA: alpha/beta hydrolase [Steroidobacteraceae bacterium]|jgi:pimeloyl-ACP methyl ester carboxylesterase
MPASPFDTRGFSREEYRICGIRTVVYSIGAGAPLMYWHGRGTWHGFAWARQLAGSFRVILPYHPGFGESEDDLSIQSPADYVRHYVELFDLLRLPQVALIGASFGGYLAAHFALAQPQRLSRLILASPFGLSAPEYPRPNYADVSLDDLPGWFVVDRSVVAPFWPDRWTERREREAASGQRALSRAPADNSWADGLAALHLPALILWGRNDRLLPSGLSGLWQWALPQAQLRIIDHAGHLLLDESAQARRVLQEYLSAS